MNILKKIFFIAILAAILICNICSGDVIQPLATFSTKYVDNSSPLVADIHPGYPGKEIVVAALQGGVFMFSNAGAQIWNYDPGVGIDSSPAAADMDGDGYLDIIIGVGSLDEDRSPHGNGGIIVLNRNGGVIWSMRGDAITPVGVLGTAALPYSVPEAINIVPGHSNQAEYMESTPAIADVDKDGRPEVFIGCLDRNFYGFNHDGTLLDFGVDDDGDGKLNEDPNAIKTGSESVDDDGDKTHNCNTITGKCIDEDPPDWPIHNQDTVFSSAGIGDIEGDGDMEIIFGGDSTDGPSSYCPGGGKLWFFDYRGVSGRKGNYPLPIGSQIMPAGDVLCKGQIFASSPALADIDNDGKLEIFTGTGNYSPYYSNSDTQMMFGFDDEGEALEGFPYNCGSGHQTRSSPAIGDINGDGVLEVVFCSGNYNGSSSKLHAVNSVSGASISGYPITPATNFSAQIASPIIADVDGDSRPDVIVPFLNHVYAYDGFGTQLFDHTLNGAGAFQNSVVADDIDNDGKIEIVAGGPSTIFNGIYPTSSIFVFKAGTFHQSAQHWPMFRNNINRTGLFRYPANWAFSEGWDTQNNWECFAGSGTAPSSIGSYTGGLIQCKFPTSPLPSPGFFQWLKWNSGHTGVEAGIAYAPNSIYITSFRMKADANTTVPMIRLRAQSSDNKWTSAAVYGGDPAAGQGGVPSTTLNNFYFAWEPQGTQNSAFFAVDIFNSSANTGRIDIEDFVVFRVNNPLDFTIEKDISNFSGGWATLGGMSNVSIGSNITISDTATWSTAGAFITCANPIKPTYLYRLRYTLNKNGGNPTDSVRLRAADAANGSYSTGFILTQDISTTPKEYRSYHVGMNNRSASLGDLAVFIDTIDYAVSASSVTLSKLYVEKIALPELK